MNIDDVLSNLTKVLSLSNTSSPAVPAPLVLLGSNRKGLSSIEITSRILEKKQQLGLPTGTLTDGSANIDDQLIYAIVDEVIKAIKFDSKIAVSIQPFGTVVAAGVTAVGIPCSTTGVITTIQTGSAIIS
jgi:hypothetical protein